MKFEPRGIFYLFEEVQRFVDLYITVAEHSNDTDYNENVLKLESFKSKNMFFSNHMLQVMLSYLRKDCENFLCKLEDEIDQYCGDCDLKCKATFNLIMKDLQDNPSNVLYYTTFVKLAILRSLYIDYFNAEAGWFHNSIRSLVIDAFERGVLKGNYDRIRVFGLSCAVTILREHNWNTNKILGSYATFPKLKKVRFPDFVQKSLGNKKFYEELEREKIFIGYTNTEIRSAMEKYCIDAAKFDHKLLHYVASASFLATYLIRIKVDEALEFASDIITRKIKSYQIDKLESEYYS